MSSEGTYENICPFVSISKILFSPDLIFGSIYTTDFFKYSDISFAIISGGCFINKYPTSIRQSHSFSCNCFRMLSSIKSFSLFKSCFCMDISFTGTGTSTEFPDSSIHLFTNRILSSFFAISCK